MLSVVQRNGVNEMGTEQSGSENRAISTKSETGSRWHALRTVLGVMYLLGALAHAVLGILAPEIYQQFANQTLVGLYADLWRSLVVPSLPILQPLVILFEIGLAVALCWRGRIVLLAHGAGAVFQAGLVLSGPWGPINAVLALLHVASLRRSYPRTIISLVRRRRTEMSQ